MHGDDDDRSEIVGALSRLISEHFHLDLSSGAASLLDRGLSFDSVSLIQLIVLIEEHFQISFDEDELRPEVFTDLRGLSKLVSDQLARRAK